MVYQQPPDHRDGNQGVMPGRRLISAAFGLLLAGFVAIAAADAFWIGETGPTGPQFTGPQQYPFVCTTYENNLGQPLVDNQNHIGNAVFPEVEGEPDYQAEPIGYSYYCSIPTRVDYFYYSRKDEEFLPLPDPEELPGDMARITVKGEEVNFVVRLERGTINRFIYGIAMLAPFVESLEGPAGLDNSAWNGRLVYKFQGGVGIGHWQGLFALRKEQALHYDSLKRGYAVAYSTGTRTGTHYNLRLAEETALMVKRHFIAIYGEPEYTVGLGGSGGGIQQYVIGQNNPRIIDAAIPQLAYPDMITQTIHTADCELLERYFDLSYSANPRSRWGDWLQRALIQGMSTNDKAFKRPWSLLNTFAPKPGSSACVNGWRGLLPYTFNPAWTHPLYYEGLRRYRYPAEFIKGIKWTHWNDLGNIYPQDERGYAPNSWDNVGVQYGLKALLDGKITRQEFLDLNACVGGWKPPQEMSLGNYPWNREASLFPIDPWDLVNMNLSEGCRTDRPAPRTEGSMTAMNRAYTSGHVFTGRLDIPIIDIRWYLDPVLDMHHAQASFAARARMIEARGHADNQLIKIAECSKLNPVSLRRDCAYDPTGDTLDLIDQWMANIRTNPAGGVVDNRPPEAVDACTDGEGRVLAAGTGVWDGVLDDRPKGACAQRFPIHSTSRMVAGDSIKSDIFKCALKPVDTALRDGTYGEISFTLAEVERLRVIFPTGVCDYSQPDVGRPKDWE